MDAMRTPNDGRQALAARWFDAHGATLYRHALMLLADAPAAEDVLQQVFARVIGRAGGVEPDDPLHYLRRAVRNECYSVLRRRRARARADEATGLLEPVAEATTLDGEVPR